jgi:hypothetical protein
MLVWERSPPKQRGFDDDANCSGISNEAQLTNRPSGQRPSARLVLSATAPMTVRLLTMLVPASAISARQGGIARRHSELAATQWRAPACFAREVILKIVLKIVSKIEPIDQSTQQSADLTSGRFQSQLGQSNCRVCLVGFTSYIEGATQSVQCLRSCPEGTYTESQGTHTCAHAALSTLQL